MIDQKDIRSCSGLPKLEEEELNLKDIGKGIKTGKKYLARIINADRYKTWSNGYKFDKWIFQIIMFGIFGLMFFIAYSNNFELNSFTCSRSVNNFNIGSDLKGLICLTDNSNCCKNPFYEPTDWTNREYLPPGEYGFKPGPIFNGMGFIATLLFSIGLLLNHLIYNRKFFKGGLKNGYDNNNNK